MITDWRGERRIGAPKVHESLWLVVRLPLIMLAYSLVGATFALLIASAVGEWDTLRMRVLMWSAAVLILMSYTAFSLAARREWAQSALSLCFGIGTAWLAVRISVPLLAALGLVDPSVRIEVFP